MQIVYVLALVTVVQGYALSKERKRRSVTLPPPHIKKVKVLDLPGFKLQWSPVRGENSDPVLGYKIFAWEVPYVKKIIHKEIDRAWIPVEENVPEEEVDNKPPKTVPEVVTVGANETEGSVENIKPDVYYELRVLAFTKNVEGPLSDSYRVKIIGDILKSKV